jgi:hypothetical protein
LNIAFLHDVEKADLHLPGEIRKLVDNEESTVGAGQEPIVNSQLVRDVLSGPSGLYWIDVADHVSDGYVGRGKFLDVSFFGGAPGNGGIIAETRAFVPALFANWPQRMIANFAPRYVRHAGVKQTCKHSRQTRLGLTPQTQKDEIVSRQDRIHDLWDHCVIKSHQTREQRFTPVQFADEIGSKLFFEGSIGLQLIEKAAGAKRAQRPGQVGVRH